MSAGASRRLFRFGLFEADLENVRLTRRGVPVHLQEQPFRVLAVLLKHSGTVVTREDLRQELWPAGTYVSFDASLNMALKRLRAALDDDADNPRFIETVPKRGYRFIAPVNVEGSPMPAAGDSPPIDALISAATGEAGPIAKLLVSPSMFSKRFLVAVVSAAAVVIAVAVFLALRKRATPPSVSAAGKSVDIGSLRASVAVLGFQNASGRPSDAWLSTALAEMLRTELGADGKLRVIPGEDVARFRVGAPWSETDSLSRQTTSRVGRALDSDLLVLGSFAVLGNAPGDGSIRVDFRLQDAQTGKILYEGTESGNEKQFFGLAATVGTDLRERLGLPMISESEEAGVVSSLPSDPDANRLYSLGLEKLREEDSAAAKDLFLQAEQTAPNFPLVHLMLSRAWGELGYDEKSRAEAKRAFALSGSLPETDRLLAQVAYYGSLHDKDKTIAASRALFSLHPDTVFYGLVLFDTLNSAGRSEEALAVVHKLRKLPSPSADDPRIDLAQSMIETDPKVAQAFLNSAIAKANAQGQKLLYARLRLSQCVSEVYGPNPQGGVRHCQEAYDILMAAGNRLLAADALRTMGDRRGTKGDLSGARELYRRALMILLPMGEHEKTGVVLNNIADSYEQQGQIAQAEKLYRQAADTWSECGDFWHAGFAIANVADTLVEHGRLRAAESEYQRARTLMQTTNPNDAGGALSRIAAVRLDEGDVAGANRFSERALAMARYRKDSIGIAGASETMGEVQISEDDLVGARQSFQQALSILQQRADRLGVAEVDAALAEVSLDQGKFVEAEQHLRRSLSEFRAENAVPDEIPAETNLARALFDEGKLTDARQAVSDAMALSATSRDPNLKLPVAIIDARVRAAELSAHANAKSKPDFAVPRRELLKVITIARHLGYFGIECDSRLALAEMELRENPASGHARLAELAREAHQHGMNLVAHKATALAASAAARSSRIVSELR